MNRFPNLSMAALLAALLAIGAVQGGHLGKLREAEAFYRWIQSAATADRLGWEHDEEYGDMAFFKEVASAAENYLPEIENTANPERQVSALALHFENTEMDQEIWELVRSEHLAEQRSQFLELAKQNNLAYAQNISYVKVLEGEIPLFQMFLGFRKVAANFIWLQVDALWHQGVIHRVVPLMKTCVLLDPNFVDAYLLGSWHLAYNVTAKMQPTPNQERTWSERHQACIGKKNQYYYFAVEYLRDGITHNQRDYRLYFDLGFSIYAEKLKNYEKAVEYLSLAVKQRHDVWVPRQLYICLEKNEQYEQALQGWKDYQGKFPDTNTGSEVAPRKIQRNLGLIYEREAVKLRQAAKENPEEAEENLAKARELEGKATDIWKEMRVPFAEARILRLEAQEHRAHKEYHEAIAKLDQARYIDPGDFNWNAASDLIMDIKLEGGIPLTRSERHAIERDRDAGPCIGEPT